MRSKLVYEMRQNFLPANESSFLEKLREIIRLYISRSNDKRGGENTYYVITPFPLTINSSYKGKMSRMDNHDLHITIGYATQIQKNQEKKENFDARVFVYKADKQTLLLKATLSDVRNLYIFRGREITEKDIERQKIFIHQLDSTVSEFYTELLTVFLHREDGTWIFENVKRSEDPTKNYIPIREEIVQFFDITTNALTQKKFGIKVIETGPFLFFKGDDPEQFDRVRHKKKESPSQFYKRHQNDESETQNNVNDTRKRFFINKIVLVEFLFQELLPAILDCKSKGQDFFSVQDMSVMDLRGEAVVKWLCYGAKKKKFNLYEHILSGIQSAKKS